MIKNPKFITAAASTLGLFGVPVAKFLLGSFRDNMTGKSNAQGGTANNETHNHYYLGNGTGPNNQLVPFNQGVINENPLVNDADKGILAGIISFVGSAIAYAIHKGAK